MSQGAGTGRLAPSIVLWGLLLLLAQHVSAQPSALEPWKQWLRDQHPELDCPRALSSNNGESGAERLCLWPSELRVELESRGASFELSVDVLGEAGLVALPGNAQFWPSSLSINGRPASPLVERNRMPYVALPLGQHRVRGFLAWQQQPESISIPASIALVSVFQDGRWLPVARQGETLRLSPRERAKSEQQHDSLSIEVYRKLSDGIPMRLDTQLVLSVSGASREVVLGPVVPEQTLPMALDSPLPARLESDRRLRLQLSPGVHRIQLSSRYKQPLTQYVSASLGTPSWPAAEFLSFEDNHALRSVKLTGARAVDTSQVNLPAGWSQLPTYRIDTQSVLAVETEARGDSSPAANEIRVRRDLWLDFDGHGLTALDRIDGSMSQGWRLDAADGVQIGRASADGKPVLITEHRGLQGLEVRSPTINLEAVTKMGDSRDFSAVGWNTQAESLQATVHLPPAWKALHVSGAESARGTWISQWNLWEVFLLMVIVASTRRLFNNRVAVLAAVAYLLALQESGSPLTLVPVLLVLLALSLVANESVKYLLKVVGALVTAALVLILIEFAVESFRLAIYPSLERAEVGDYYRRADSWEYDSQSGVADILVAPAEAPVMSRAPMKLKSELQAEPVYDPTDIEQVQTGPGQPAWTWRSIGLTFSGPVAESDRLHFYLLPPWMTSLWRIVMVIACGLLSAVVIHRFFSVVGGTGTAGRVGSTTALGALLGLCLMTAPDALQAQAFPPQQIIERLEQQLLEPPACWPECAAINGATLTAGENEVSLVLDVYSDAHIALPLPQTMGSLQWLKASRGGQSLALSAAADGDIRVELTPGNHRLQLEGRLSGDSWSIRWRTSIHNLRLKAEGWVTGGWVNGRVQGDTLSFRREVRQEQQSKVLRNDPAPALVSVQRQLRLSRQWDISTTVTRMAPAQEPFTVRVALLPGEQILHSSGELKNGEMELHFRPGQTRLMWSSRLEPVSEFSLQASDSHDQIETWELLPSDRWRLSYEGIPANRSSGKLAYLNVFQPWPGESLQVNAHMPSAVAGPSHTVERLSLEHSGGRSLEKTDLKLSIRASLAEDFEFSLPETAKVTQLSYAGKPLNLPDDHRLIVPLIPGENELVVSFQQAAEGSVVHRSPALILEEDVTNVRLSYQLPRDQWPLYISGPAIGPAMLFWGVLCVILLGAFLLDRLAKAQGLSLPISLGGWILLGVGLSTVNSYGVLAAAVFFFSMAARAQKVKTDQLRGGSFNLMQLGLIGLALVTLLSLVAAIPMGLLSDPQMKVTGNGSYSHHYRYYQDVAAAGAFPQVTVFSVPLIVYRAAMLLWSLWLATQLMVWARWGWDCYRQGGAWRSGRNPTATDQGQTASQQES